MAVVEREKQACGVKDMMIDPRIKALIGPPAYRANNGSGAAEGGDGAGLLGVMCDPCEWKSAVRFALVIFVGFLALTPALAPDRKKLAAQINHQTLKAAAAIKSSTR